MNFGFIGLGNMATAIISGMVKSGNFADDKIYGFDISKERCEFISQTLKIQTVDSVKELVKKCDTIVLAVKPQVITGVFDDIKSIISGKQIISIAAGKTVAFLENGLGSDNRIIRVMPNINAMVGAATSAYTANDKATDDDKKIAEKIFGTVGTIVELPEKLFSIFTAIGGSSPAFAYMYIDALARVGVQHGMTKEMALKVAASTVYGSAKMVMESGVHPMELCDRVCSPAGTTIDGVIRLQADGFEAAIHDAITAVVQKDKSL